MAPKVRDDGVQGREALQREGMQLRASGHRRKRGRLRFLQRRRGRNQGPHGDVPEGGCGGETVMIETLKKFCATDALHPNLATPWSAGEYSLATNGHVLIRVPRLADVPERDDAPGTDSLFPYKEPPAWYPLAVMPNVEGPAPITEKTCPDCNGTVGEEGADCPECDGDGIVEFDNLYSDYEIDCKTCDGERKIKKCETCKSTGKIEVKSLNPVAVAGAHFQLHYLLLLKGLPNCNI